MCKRKGDLAPIHLLKQGSDNLIRPWRPDQRKMRCTAMPGRQQEVAEIPDMIIMMVCQENQGKLMRRCPGAYQLRHNAAPGIKQDVFAAARQQHRAPLPFRQWVRAAGAE
jgi:hypothetical protein